MAGVRASAEQAIRAARDVGDKRAEARFLNIKAGAEMSLFRYQAALHSYLAARRLAQETRDWQLFGIVCSNLSSLYLQQNEASAARQAIRQGIQSLNRGQTGSRGALMRAQAAILEARGGRLEAAHGLFVSAAEEAEAAGDAVTTAMVWDQWGYELLEWGLRRPAETALLEAYRLRRLNGMSDLACSYYTLGRLRLEQGDAGTARRLLELAMEQAGSSGIALPSWRLHYELGRAKIAAGQVQEGRRELERAMRSLSELRSRMLPAESVWVSSGEDQQRVFRAYLEASASLFESTGHTAFIREAFAALAETQANGLLALVHAPREWIERLADEYWRTLAELRTQEGRLWQEESEEARAAIEELEFKLTEAEARAGLVPRPPGGLNTGAPTLVKRIQEAVGPDAALIAFHLGDAGSYRWAVTSASMHFDRIGKGSDISGVASRFRRAIQQGAPEAENLGARLYQQLFSGLPESVQRQHRWLLSLDGELFLTPFAALATELGPGGPRFLVEMHSVQIIPSALLLEAGTSSEKGPFVAVGDPIYNRADPRLRRGAPGMERLVAGLPSFAGLFGQRGTSRPALARLIGSGREVETCARAWSAKGYDSVLLTGREATPARLRAALSSKPSVLHLATHFVLSGGGTPQAMAVLSLGPDGVPEMLSPSEIARWRLDGGTVVLSGCGSAVAGVRPAEGLIGMTRAWLAAGAKSVLASLWPTTDDTGELFEGFYRHLAAMRGGPGCGVTAEALRQAQLEMLRKGGWQSKPGYWGAHIVFGKE